MMSIKNDPLKPAVITHRMTIKAGKDFNNALIKNRLNVFLADLTNALQEKGCRLIGHIKGMVEAPESGQTLFFSITDFQQEPSFKGSFAEGGEEAQLSINVIVYGVEKSEATAALEECLSRNLL